MSSIYIQKRSSKTPTSASAELRISMKAPLTASTGPLSTSGARYWASAPWPRRLPTPVRWAKAPTGVGNERFAAWSSRPSGSSSRQPQMPISGRESISATSRSSVESRTSVSGFRTRTYGAAHRPSPMLVARAKPRFASFATSSMSGNSDATISTVPSPEALSTTTMRPPAEPRLARQRRRSSRQR